MFPYFCLGELWQSWLVSLRRIFHFTTEFDGIEPFNFIPILLSFRFNLISSISLRKKLGLVS